VLSAGQFPVEGGTLKKAQVMEWLAGHRPDCTAVCLLANRLAKQTKENYVNYVTVAIHHSTISNLKISPTNVSHTQPTAPTPHRPSRQIHKSKFAIIIGALTI